MACATEAARYRAEMDKVTSDELQRQQQLAHELQQQLVTQTDKTRLADLVVPNQEMNSDLIEFRILPNPNTPLNPKLSNTFKVFSKAHETVQKPIPPPTPFTVTTKAPNHFLDPHSSNQKHKPPGIETMVSTLSSITDLSTVSNTTTTIQQISDEVSRFIQGSMHSMSHHGFSQFGMA